MQKLKPPTNVIHARLVEAKPFPGRWPTRIQILKWDVKLNQQAEQLGFALGEDPRVQPLAIYTGKPDQLTLVAWINKLKVNIEWLEVREADQANIFLKLVFSRTKIYRERPADAPRGYRDELIVVSTGSVAESNKALQNYYHPGGLHAGMPHNIWVPRRAKRTYYATPSEQAYITKSGIIV
jgi:hypothetical protein